MIHLPKLTILGGSSPFTIEFIDCLLHSNISPYELMLFGRNQVNLASVFHYAKVHLSAKGWSVSCSADIDQALEGANIVVHQIRYGGLDGRQEDETFSRKFNFPADETLGPAGLRSAIRMAPWLFALAEKINSNCPNALVINLTNPLSVAVSLLKEYGVSSILGVCELPQTTASKIADSLGIPSTALNWSYAGLNHRGFIYNLSSDGEDVLPRLLDRNRDGFNGFQTAMLADLEAIPLKYFRLILSRERRQTGRAEPLKMLAGKVLSELAGSPFNYPPSLRERNMDWYKMGLVPVLEAMDRDQSTTLVLNTPNDIGVTLERKMLVSKNDIVTLESTRMPSRVKYWMNLFYENEKSVLKAALDPSELNISLALNSDPLVVQNVYRPEKSTIVDKLNETIKYVAQKAKRTKTAAGSFMSIKKYLL